MSAPKDPSSSEALIHAELTGRIREALTLKDWVRLEHWSKQWILLAPKQGTGFKWLARAYLSQSKFPKAAYAYRRLLDFDGQNIEARRFFAEYPSLFAQPGEATEITSTAAAPAPVEAFVSLTPEQRQRLAQVEAASAGLYEHFFLYSEAAQRFAKSYEWSPNQQAALGAARCLHLAQQGLKATQFLRREIAHYPDWVEGRLQLARVLFDLGHLADAQREWQAVLRLDPRNDEALRHLSHLHLNGPRAL